MTAEATPEPVEYPATRDARCPFDPPAVYGELRERAGLTRVRVWDGSTPWLVTRYDDALSALRDPRLSMDARLPGFPGISAASVTRLNRVSPFFFREESVYLRQRGMLIKEFVPKKLEALRPSVQRIVDDTLDALLAGPRPADLLEGFALPVATLVMCELLGVDRRDRLRLHELSRIVASRKAAPDQVSRALDGLDEYFLQLTDAQVREPGDDLVGRALTPRVRSGELSREDAAAMAQVLFFSGHGTSTAMIVTGALALLTHHEQLAELRAARDPAVLAATVEELLRYVTVAHNGRQRVAAEDTVIGRTPVRAGDGVLIQLDAANRDPSVFAEPDRFDIHRAPYRHLALGHGIHHCMGQALARIELQVALGTLFARVPTLRLAVRSEDVPFKEDENALRLDSLPVTW
ncbi:cytochrome P450 [Streptomyces sp.]|uniref:cytochrome P450 n=1 Tax=Streptomyces sp. TaxID=1931 RepID=UPI002F3EDFD8